MEVTYICPLDLTEAEWKAWLNFMLRKCKYN